MRDDRVTLSQFEMENEQYKALEQRVDELEYAIEQLQRRTKLTRKELGVNSMATLAFLGLLGVLILGIRLEFGGFTFSIPLELLIKALELPVAASIVAAITKLYLDSRSQTRRHEDDESHNPPIN